jgi:Flp pilus assembly protein CpaB
MTYRVRNLVIALGLALFAVLIVSVYVSQVKRDVSSGNKPVTVYVAKTDISAGTPGAEIAQNLLVATKVPHRDVVPGAISNPNEITDSVTSQQIYQGEQVIISRFSSSAEGGVRGEISGNQRVIEVAGTPQQTLAGTLKDGDHVDVVATWKVPEDSEHHVSRVLLRNLLVVNAPDSAPLKSSLTSGMNSNATVQLRMTDLQSHVFFWVVENGAWSLVLRPPIKAANSPENIRDASSIAVAGLLQSADRKIGGGK